MKIITVSWRSHKLAENAPPEKPAVVVSPQEEEAAKAGDSKAAHEAKQLASGKSIRTLSDEAIENEHRRDQRFKEHFECVSLIALWTISFGVFGAASIWFWHIIMPPKWRWLDWNEVQAIQTGLTGIVLVGVIADHFKKRLR